MLYCRTDSTQKKLAVIFIAGILLRLVIFGIGYLNSGGNYFMTFSDSGEYVTLAQNILHGNGFSMAENAPYLPDSIRTPGFPIFIATSFLISNTIFPAIFLLLLLGAFLPFLVYEILRRLDFSKTIAIVVSVIVAFEPLQTSFSVFAVSEILFIFIFLLSWLFYLEYYNSKRISILILSAFFWGIATLVRPVGFYVLALFAIHFIWKNGWRKKQAWVYVATFILTAAIVVLPWMYRNFSQFRSWELSAVPYYNIFVWHGGSILAIENNIPFNEAQKITSSKLFEQGYGVSDSLFAKDFMVQEGLKIIREHPIAFLKLDIMNSWKFFTMDGYYDLAKHLNFYQNYNTSPLTFLDLGNSLRKIPSLVVQDPMFFLFITGRLIWIALFPIFLAGAFLSLRNKENRARDTLLLLMILYFMLASLSTGFGMNARFRMPVSLFYMAYVVFALIQIKFLLTKHTNLKS